MREITFGLVLRKSPDMVTTTSPYFFKPSGFSVYKFLLFQYSPAS